jgi:chromosome segregation ATPase
MSKPSLFQRLAPPASSAKIEERLVKARQAVSEAEARYRAAALEAVTAGQDSSPAEYSAEEALAKARAEVSRLEAALAEAQVRERTQASSALEAQQAAQDAKVQKAFDDWAATAKAISPALEAYASAYDAFVDAGSKATGLALTNPRARQDILIQNGEALVSSELSRVAKAHMPPGFNALAATMGNRRDLTPLADHVAGLASVILRRP